MIGDYGREQTDYRYVLYMTPLQKTQTIPLKDMDDFLYFSYCQQIQEKNQNQQCTNHLLIIYNLPLFVFDPSSKSAGFRCSCSGTTGESPKEAKENCDFFSSFKTVQYEV